MTPKDLLPTLSGFFDFDPKLLAFLGLVVPLLILGGPKVYKFLQERIKLSKRAGPNVQTAPGALPAEPDVSAKELLAGWRRFLARLPRRYQRSILNFEHFVVMGIAASGKSRLIDKQSDWLFQMKQVARDAPVDPTFPFYIGSGAVISELPARYLEDSSDRCRQALDVLWRRLYKQRAPTVVVAVDVNWAMAATRDELSTLARNVRMKVNHLNAIRGRAIEVRVALTHGDTLKGFAESAKFWAAQGIANRVPLAADGPVGASLRAWVIESQQQLPRALATLTAGEYRSMLAFVRKTPELLAPLEHLLDVLFVRDPASSSPLRGGVYFCTDVEGSLSPVSQAHESGPGPDPAQRQLIVLTVAASACVTYFGLAYSAQYEAWQPANDAMRAYEVSLDKGGTLVGSQAELTARRAINRFTVEHRGLLARFPGFLDAARARMKQELTTKLRQNVLIPNLEKMALTGVEDKNGNTLRWRRSIYCLGVIHSDSEDRLDIRENILLYSAMTALDGEVIEDYLANSDTAYAEPVPFELQAEVNPEDLAEKWLEFPETIERILADNLLTEDELQKLQERSKTLRKALARFRDDEVTLKILNSLDSAANTQNLDGVRRHVRLNDEYGKRYSFVKGVTEENHLHKTFDVIEEVLQLVDSTRFHQLTMGAAQGTLKALVDDLTLLKEAPATLSMTSETLKFELAHHPISIDVKRWRDVLNHSRADAAVKHFVDKAQSHPSIFFTPAVENGLPDVVWNATGTEATIFVGRARLRGRYTTVGFDKGIKGPLQRLNRLLASFELDPATQSALAATLKTAVTHYAFEYNAEAEQFLRTFRVNTPTAESLRVALGQIAAEKSSFSEFVNLLDENTDLQLDLIDVDDEVTEAEALKLETAKANAGKSAMSVSAPPSSSTQSQTTPALGTTKAADVAPPAQPTPPFVLAELLSPMTQSLAGFEPWHLAVGAKRGGAELTKYREIANQLLTDLSAAADAEAPAPKGGKADEEGAGPALEAELTPTGRASLAALRADAGAYYAMAKNWATGAGLTPIQRQPFLAPFAELSQIGDRDIGDVVRRVWKTEMRPIVRDINTRFPFNRSAEKFVDPEELSEYFHPIDGKFFQLFRSYLEPVSSFGDGQPFRPLGSAHAFNLPPDLYPTVNAVAALSARLWDEKGDPRPLEVRVATVPFVTQPNATLVPTVVHLSVGKTSIFNFNQRPDTAALPLDWTQDDDAQLALHVTDVASGETTFPAALAAPGKYWRFFRLLRAAKAHHTEADGSEVYEWERPTQDGSKQRTRVRLRFEEESVASARTLERRTCAKAQGMKGLGRIRRVLVAALSASCAQCASASSSSLKLASVQQQSDADAERSSMELVVNSTRDTNQGNVLHMMVRSLNVDKAVTTTESYEDATTMLFATERDPDVVAAQPIFPGHATRLQLKEPLDNSVVLYFFFTNPGESWRVQVSSPPPDEVTIELGANEVASVSVER